LKKRLENNVGISDKQHRMSITLLIFLKKRGRKSPKMGGSKANRSAGVGPDPPRVLRAGR